MPDSSVAISSGHRVHRSFASYTNLRGTLGKRQQAGILGEFEDPATKRLATRSKNVDFEIDLSRVRQFAAMNEKCDVVVREPEVPVHSFLRNHGHFSGNVTINVNYGVGAGKIGPGGTRNDA
ncbi:hypothetical protein FGB62_213g09 [Gracilaria domingensis]|nr:hypothetical protein FGB62_213g09 [Gracilaria domingensis]